MSEPTSRPAHVDQLHPRVREAIRRVVADAWPRECAAYQRLPADERDGHLFQHVNALRYFLGNHSPIGDPPPEPITPTPNPRPPVERP